MTARDEIVEWTKALRRSDEPYWHDLRVELSARGISASDAAVADVTPDEDGDMLWLVTPDGRFFEIDFHGPYIGERGGPHSITRYELLSQGYELPAGWFEDSRLRAAFEIARRNS